MQNAQASIDPNLGYNFLLNGVIHVVPFLLKIWNTKGFALECITDGDLQNAGIKNSKDREGVLKSIKEFIESNSFVVKNIDDESCFSKDIDLPQLPTAPSQEPKSPTISASSAHDLATSNVECVVCMDAVTRVIFLPCGMFKMFHLFTFSIHLNAYLQDICAVA